jgi:hypothetical protein
VAGVGPFLAAGAACLAGATTNSPEPFRSATTCPHRSDSRKITFLVTFQADTLGHLNLPPYPCDLLVVTTYTSGTGEPRLQ